MNRDTQEAVAVKIIDVQRSADVEKAVKKEVLYFLQNAYETRKAKK